MSLRTRSGFLPLLSTISPRRHCSRSTMSPVTSTATIEGPGSLKFFTKTWTPAAEVPVVASVIFVHG